MKKKELYAAPETEVLELRLETAILEVSGGAYPENEYEDLG